MAPPRSLLVFADDWGRHPSSCQHLVARLADKYQVVWVNTIGMRRPHCDWSTLKRGCEKAVHWLWRQRPATGLQPVRIVNPLMWPWLSRPRDRWLNRLMLLRQLNGLLPNLPRPVAAVTTLPIVADLVGGLAVDRWIYYCVDDFSQWPGLDQPMLAEMEEKLVPQMDAVVAASDRLAERIGRLGRASVLLTHGVDVSFWKAGSSTAASVDKLLEGSSPPHVLFWGVIDRRMDVDWLARLAGALSRGSIVLVGPQDNPDPAIERLVNVHCPGPVVYEQLPQLAAAAAVLIMPYRNLPVTQAMQPLKMKEYLATGRPAVVRRLPAVCEWVDCLDAVDTAEDFAQHVLQRLATGLPRDQQLARARLEGESWAAKAHQLDDVIENTTTANDTPDVPKRQLTAAEARSLCGA